MESKFGDYPEINNTASLQAENIALAGPKKHKEKDMIKILNSVRKALRKQNKLLKKEQRQRKTEQQQQQQQQQQQEDSIKESNCKNMKGFFTKLGDAICKAVPSVLTAIATAAIGWLFKMKPKVKNYQTC